jgi:NAD(P)-dependent dehydrogenase (short-subunit alcohol dehydrogenase family)
VGQLAGLTAIVTGSGSGIGRACALRFAHEGANLALCDLTAEGLDETKAMIEEQVPGAVVHSAVVDLAVVPQIDAFVDSVADRFGAIDVIYNNAGVSIQASIEDHTEEMWDKVVDVNLKAQFFIIKRALPWLRRSSAPSVVNVGSMASQFGHDRLAAYCSAKGGVLQLTRALAVELAPSGIRVNCVCPGLTRTPMLESAFSRLSPEEAQHMVDGYMGRQLFKRLAEPDEVVSAAVFLASAQSSFITGEVISVSGGWQAW